MKDLKQDIAKMLAQASKSLGLLIASTSFDFWNRADFQMYVEFDNQSQLEQDRMFNEFQVSLLGLFILHLDHALLDAKREQKVLISVLQKDLPQGFLQIFLDLGVEKKIC